MLIPIYFPFIPYLLPFYQLFYLMIILTDNNWFLCTSIPEENPKTYTITAGWEHRSSSDHTVLVSHKWSIKEISWKDIGNTMQLIRLVSNKTKEINESNDLSDWFVRTVRSILGRYTGYDEHTNQQYYYIPKLTGEKLIATLNQLDFFVDKYDINIIDEKKWWFTIHDTIIITEQEREKYMLWQFLWLCIVYGKPTIHKEIFTAYKIQVPILRYEISEQLNKIIHLLRDYNFVVTINYNTDQQVYEITTNDYDLLAYIRILYGDEMNASLIDKILDLQKEIFIQYGISAQQKSMRWKLYEVKRN